MPAILFSLVLVLSGFCSLGASAADVAIAGRTVLIVADEEKRDGYLASITLAALKREGYVATISYMPWRRALQQGMEGAHVDIVLGAYLTEERARKMAFSSPIGRAELYLFALRSHPVRYSALADLAPYRIGKVRGAVVSQAFDRAAFLHVEEAVDVNQNIRKLLAGRLDLFVDKKLATLYALQHDFGAERERVQLVDPPLHVDYFYNAFPKNRPAYRLLLADFERGLKSLREDGSYDAIVKQAVHE